jgi:hypothetical protein
VLGRLMRASLRVLAAAANILVLAAVCAVAAGAVRDFSRYVDHYPYLATDDSVANVSYALATEGRYGFLSSPMQGYAEVTRHDGFFNYGPWYFYIAAGLIWLFGYSLALLRSIHLGTILIIAGAACWWFGRRGQLAAGALVALGLIHAFEMSHWPMVRPDSTVAMFAVLCILAAGRAIETGSSLQWFFAGLTAVCAAFTHLIAWALAPCCVVMLTLSWIAARPASAGQRGRQLAAVILGGTAAAVMFYGSFGFRVRDQLSMLGGYGQFLGTTKGAAGGYRSVLATHLGLAFGYLSPAVDLLLALSIAGAAVLLVVSWWRPEAERRQIAAWILPPFAVLSCYVVSLGTYANFHQGYAILTQVAAWWCAASAIAVALMLLARRSGVLADAARIGVSIVILIVAGRHIEARTLPNGRLTVASHWVSIREYSDRIAELVPARSTVWGSVAFGIENPGRMQLVQFSEGLTVVDRSRLLHPAETLAIAPEYLVWGYAESRDHLLMLFGPKARDFFGNVERLLPDVHYRLIGLVAGRPYGVTRVYARRFEPPSSPALMPVVSAYDPSTGAWNRSIEGPVTARFGATSPVTFAIGYDKAAPPVTADRSVVGDVPKGNLLLRVQVRRSVDATRRGLGATTVGGLREVIGELGPDASFTPYDGRDDDVYFIHEHPGGPLYVSQFDNGRGAAIEGVEVYRIRPQLDPTQRAETVFREFARFTEWRPSAGVHATMHSTDLVVDGNATPIGYQISSPRTPVPPHDQVRVRTQLTTTAGRVCLGALNGDESKWLAVANDQSRALEFTADDSGAFVLVVVNCNGNATAAPSRFVMSAATYTIQPPGLYVDRLMALGVSPTTGGDRGVYTFPPGLSITPAALARVKSILRRADYTFNAPIANATPPDGWTIKGTGDAPYSYLMASKPQITGGNRLLLAAGRLQRGGITVGLLKDAAWAAQVNVTEPGLFTVVIQPPGQGTYEIIVANNLPGPSREIDAAISRIAWIER